VGGEAIGSSNDGLGDLALDPESKVLFSCLSPMTDS